MAALSTGLYKEARALSTTWAIAVASLVALSLSGVRPAFELGLAAYLAGAVFLGAESVGQEYSCRTLSVLLSQPIDRRRLYAQKMTVLAVMLLLLAAVQWAVRGEAWAQLPAGKGTNVWLLPILGGGLMAPWLSMIARSVLGGASLTCFVAGLTWIALMLVPVIGLGSGADEAGAIALGYLPRVMVAMCLVAAVLGWRKFTNLEVIEGDVAVISLPRLNRAEGARGRRPWRALISKELHLQQLTFGITIQYFVVWGLLGLVLRLSPAWSDFPFGAVTTVYCMILPIVIGAIASAEERQHGTHEGQQLQPLPAWQQWLVKAGVAFALAMAFGVGLPVLLAILVPDEATFRMAGLLMMLSVLLTAAGLYVSSLSISAVRAMVATLPAGAMLALLMQAVYTLLPPSQPVPLLSSSAIFVAIVAPVLVWLAFVNHSSTERAARRIVVQALSLAVVVVAVAIAVL